MKRVMGNPGALALAAHQISELQVRLIELEKKFRPPTHDRSIRRGQLVGDRSTINADRANDAMRLRLKIAS